jgi:hypothetical protein
MGADQPAFGVLVFTHSVGPASGARIGEDGLAPLAQGVHPGAPKGAWGFPLEDKGAGFVESFRPTACGGMGAARARRWRSGALRENPHRLRGRVNPCRRRRYP